MYPTVSLFVDERKLSVSWATLVTIIALHGALLVALLKSLQTPEMLASSPVLSAALVQVEAPEPVKVAEVQPTVAAVAPPPPPAPRVIEPIAPVLTTPTETPVTVPVETQKVDPPPVKKEEAIAVQKAPPPEVPVPKEQVAKVEEVVKPVPPVPKQAPVKVKKVDPPPLQKKKVVEEAVDSPLIPVQHPHEEEPAAAVPARPARKKAAVAAPKVDAVAVAAKKGVAEVVRPPRFDADYLDNPAPAYPRLSRRLREQGTVLLRVYVESNGAPTRVELKQSSGHTRLDEAALDAVQRWRFLPARQGDAAVAGWVIVPLSFSLRS